MGPITTHWHKFLDAASADRIVCLILNRAGENFSDHWQNTFDLGEFRRRIDYASNLPRFVFEDSAINLLNTDQAALSIGDMVFCDVIGLPFAEAVFELNVKDTKDSIIIRESLQENVKSWRCTAFSYNTKSETGVAVAYPCSVEFNIKIGSDIQNDTDETTPEMPNISYSLDFESFVKENDREVSMLEDTYLLVLDKCFKALVAALLLPQTIGLQRDTVSVKPKFNKARTQRGRAAIPTYTVIRVPSSDLVGAKSNEYGGVEVHLRRAHKKRIAFGVGRLQREWRFVPAQVVGYLPDGRKPTMLEMLATRAAKPYLLK